jgi:hypothetical protein
MSVEFDIPACTPINRHSRTAAAIGINARSGRGLRSGRCCQRRASGIGSRKRAMFFRSIQIYGIIPRLPAIGHKVASVPQKELTTAVETEPTALRITRRLSDQVSASSVLGTTCCPTGAHQTRYGQAHWPVRGFQQNRPKPVFRVMPLREPETRCTTRRCCQGNWACLAW